MNRLLLVPIALLFFTGCWQSSPVWKVNDTKNKMNHLELGMPKAKVIEIMGQPDHREMYSGKNGPIEVLFYQTTFVGALNAAPPSALTPFILINQQLKGWGKSYYDNTIRYEVTIKKTD